MGRLIALSLAFYVGTQVVFWFVKQIERFKLEKPVTPPKTMEQSPWQKGDIEDAKFEEVE
jgi:hypothetical protein